MTAETTSLAGPDFRVTGHPAAELADGAMVLGHADGEPVIVARRGAELFAVSATCSHYSGPLGEGLIVDDTVRCPWHHACFSLRTGEALRAPALNPIACWDTVQRGSRVFVTGKRAERDPLAPAGAGKVRTKVPRSVVIIGAGAAGSAAAEMLRREGYDASLIVVDAEPDSPYDRPNLSKDFLAGTAQEEWIPLRPTGFYEQHGVQIVRARATAIDSAQSRVTLADGKALPYDALLLATGAEPNRLEIPGADLPFVHVLRSLADSKAIIDAASRARTAVVIGGSFIGLEVAASLRQRKLSVDVVALESVPLERVLDKALGAAVQRMHEARGVRFHLRATASQIDARGVHLADGTVLPADLVVVGVGVRPRIELARQAGLGLDRGVVVNQYLETSVPHIFAAGDIARWPDPHSGARIRVEHWVVAQRQGQTAARNILGAREPFDAVPYFWSHHYEAAIRYSGHAEGWQVVAVTGEPTAANASVAYRSESKTIAVASIGQDRVNLEAEAALERGDEQGLIRLFTHR
jgi:apoptosis-inducing factor 3